LDLVLGPVVVLGGGGRFLMSEVPLFRCSRTRRSFSATKPPPPWSALLPLSPPPSFPLSPHSSLSLPLSRPPSLHLFTHLSTLSRMRLPPPWSSLPPNEMYSTAVERIWHIQDSQYLRCNGGQDTSSEAHIMQALGAVAQVQNTLGLGMSSFAFQEQDFWRQRQGPATTIVQGVSLVLILGSGRPSFASERRGNTLKALKDFYLKAKARIWP